MAFGASGAVPRGHASGTTSESAITRPLGTTSSAAAPSAMGVSEPMPIRAIIACSAPVTYSSRSSGSRLTSTSPTARMWQPHGTIPPVGPNCIPKSMSAQPLHAGMVARSPPRESAISFSCKSLKKESLADSPLAQLPGGPKWLQRLRPAPSGHTRRNDASAGRADEPFQVSAG